MISGDDIEAMKDTFYMHGNKDTSGERFQEACEDHDVTPTEEATRHSRYAGYEVEIRGYWTPAGAFFATHVKDSKLEKPVQI